MKYLVIIFISMCTLILSNCTTAIIDETTTDPPDQEEVTYVGDVQPIMLNYCLSCHSGTNPQAGLSLSTYEQVRSATENGSLLSYIEDESNPMPPSGLMPSAERAKVAKWATDGYK